VGSEEVDRRAQEADGSLGLLIGQHLGVDLHAVHQREVNHQDMVSDRFAGDAVPASAHADGDVIFAGEADRSHDVRDAVGADDSCRVTVDHAVPDATSLVVFLITGGEDGAAQGSAQRAQVAFRGLFGVLVHEKKATTAFHLRE
jgi:hypothetical protein